MRICHMDTKMGHDIDEHRRHPLNLDIRKKLTKVWFLLSNLVRLYVLALVTSGTEQ